MIFKKPEHQKQYEKDGYILIDFLSANETNELKSAFEKMTPWFKDGFMSSVYVPQDGYKQQVDQLLEPYGKKIVDELMNNYRVIIGMFMIKGSGEQSAMYPHQDWTLVDENKFASFNIWIPLVDVDYKNGAMSIMRGGHLLPFTIRGSNVPDALQDYSKFLPEKLTYMPMKAGQALIYDHRCIHVSPPNISGKIRPACAIGLVPDQAEAFHYFFDKENKMLMRYKADKEFYFNHVHNQTQAPSNAELIDEIFTTDFYKFSDADLQTFFENQQPRKRSFIERFFKLK